jgi:hypothetical protein
MALPMAQRKVIAPNDPWIGFRWPDRLADRTPQRGGAGGHAQTVDQASTSLTAQGRRNEPHDLAQTGGAPGMWSHKCGQALRKHAPLASRNETTEATNPQVHADRVTAPGQVGHSPLIMAVQPRRRHVAKRTGDRYLCADDGEGDGVGIDRYLIKAQTCNCRQEG